MQGNYSRIVLSDNPHEHIISVDNQTELVRSDIEQIGINEIRSLTIEVHRKPIEGYQAKKVVVSSLKITSEAQHAALKILEEPPQNISLVLVLPTGTQLLKTVISRVQLETITTQTQTSELSDWLKLSYKDRISVVEEKIKNKDSVWLQSIKAELNHYCKDNANSNIAELKELQLVTDNLLTRGSSSKMLLEHLALSLPLTS